MAYAQKRFGFLMEQFKSKAVSVNHMLAQGRQDIRGLDQDDILKTKEIVYDWIVRFLEGEGFPTESIPDFTEASINDLVYLIIIPIITNFRRKMGRSLRLRRGKEIISNDQKTGGRGEFIVMDIISIEDSKYVLVVEAKRSSMGEAKKQCLLAMQDMRGNNGGSIVYGFVTNEESWQMIRYNGTSFIQTDSFTVLLRGMEQKKRNVDEGGLHFGRLFSSRIDRRRIVQKNVVASLKTGI